MERLVAVFMALLLVFIPFHAHAADEPKFILLSVTSISEVGVLYLEEGEDVRPLNLVGHHTDFTISRGDCRLVLSTYADNGHGAYMRIKDVVEPKPDVIQTAELYFGNAEIKEFMFPSFGPDDRSYAVIAQDSSRKYLYVSNGGNMAKLIYSWSDRFMVAGIKWRNASKVALKVMGPTFDNVEYWEFDIAAGPNEYDQYDPTTVENTEYEAFVPSEVSHWEPTYTPSVAKAIECTPFKG